MRNLLVALLLAGALGACNPATPSAAPSTSLPTVLPTPIPTVPATEPVVTMPPTATAGATDTVGAPPCEPSDLKASHGLVEASGDSRLTEVVLVSAVACSVDSVPGTALQDGDGNVVAGHAAGPDVGAIDLTSGVAYTAEIQVSNWCADRTVYPLTLTVLIDESALKVTGSSFPEEGDRPPCTSGGEPVLEATAWLATP